MEQETYENGPKVTKNFQDAKVQYVDFVKSNKTAAQKTRATENNSEANQKKSNLLATIEASVSSLKPNVPVYFVRPSSLKKSAKFFLDNFSSFKDFSGKNYAGEVLYAVKSNPDATAIQYLFDAGIRHFDVASINEINLIAGMFGKDATMYFMHPVKSREAIHSAYFDHGIRDFSLDSFDELKKILDVTNNAKDLGLHIRLSIPNAHAAMDLSGKFGILPSKAVALLRKVRASAQRLGVCFHVGSQCMDPTQYRSTLMIVKDLINKAKVELDVVDIGGGFPSVYPGMTPPDLQNYVDEISDAIMQLPLPAHAKIWCEPGRALVAESGSLLVRIEARKANMLYINDGTYGGLFDAGFPAFIYPTKAYRVRKGSRHLSENKVPFGFYGPTCDSLDVMRGPFYLPENIAEGDYIEIGQLGAYSKSIRTDFNGFNHILQIEVADEPLASMYNEKKDEEEVSNFELKS